MLVEIRSLRVEKGACRIFLPPSRYKGALQKVGMLRRSPVTENCHQPLSSPIPLPSSSFQPRCHANASDLINSSHPRTLFNSHRQLPITINMPRGGDRGRRRARYKPTPRHKHTPRTSTRRIRIFLAYVITLQSIITNLLFDHPLT